MPILENLATSKLDGEKNKRINQLLQHSVIVLTGAASKAALSVNILILTAVRLAGCCKPYWLLLG